MKPLFSLYIFLAFILASCTSINEEENEQAFTIGEAFRVDTLNGECPFLTHDNHGNTVLSWVRSINDNSKALCYSISTNGHDFSPAVEIPQSGNIQPHGENLPKIIFKPSGEIIALWGAANADPRNKYAGRVFYSQSFDGGKSWEGPTPLSQDRASFDQRYYDVALLPNGEAGIIWLDNRKISGREGSDLYFATTNGRNGFQEPRIISAPACPCCRTDLFVDSKGNIHAIYRGIIQDSIRDMMHIVSTDGGNSFSTPQLISEDNWVIHGCPHTGPSMAENANGLHFAWYTGGRNPGSYFTSSKNNGGNFMEPETISGMGSHPQLTSLPSTGNLAIAWDETSVLGDKTQRRIGMQLKDAEGKFLGKEYVTPDSEIASYPVIIPIAKNTFMIAYTRSGEKDPTVQCRLVTITGKRRKSVIAKNESFTGFIRSSPANIHCSPEASGISK